MTSYLMCMYYGHSCKFVLNMKSMFKPLPWLGEVWTGNAEANDNDAQRTAA